LIARRREPLDETAAELQSERCRPDQRIETACVDVADRAAIEAALQGRPIDVLINCAGVACSERFEATAPAAFEEMMRVNYFGTLWACRSAAAVMKTRGGGRIANVSSIVGVLGFHGYAAYAPSKFAVVGLSEVLRNELKPHGIAVSVLLPPDTDTPQLAAENLTKPAATKAICGTLSPMSPDTVAGCLLSGMAAGRFQIIPGFNSRLTCWAARRFPRLVRWWLDRAVRGAGG